MEPSDAARFEEVIAEAYNLPSPYHERMKKLEKILLEHIYDIVSENNDIDTYDIPKNLEYLKHACYHMIFNNLNDLKNENFNEKFEI